MKVCLQLPIRFKFVSLECYNREPGSTVPFIAEKHSRRAWLGKDDELPIFSGLDSRTGFKKHCDAD